MSLDTVNFIFIKYLNIAFCLSFPCYQSVGAIDEFSEFTEIQFGVLKSSEKTDSLVVMMDGEMAADA